MHLENLKIEINPNYSLDFWNFCPKRNNDNTIMIYSLHEEIILPNERKIIPLELKFGVDRNSILQISSNEKILQFNGIHTLQQTITHTNKDFVNVVLWNTTGVKFNVKKGDVIAYAYLLLSPFVYDIQKVKKV